MTTVIIIGLIVVAAVAMMRNRGPKLSFETVRKDLDDGGLLLDVRTPGEFRSGHALGAKNLPLQSLQSGTLPTHDKQKSVYVYCHSGARASAASLILRRAGYSQVTNIGGLRKWQSMGGKVTN